MKFTAMMLAFVAASAVGATTVLRGDGSNAGGIGTGVTIPTCTGFTVEAWVCAESTVGENVVFAQFASGAAGRSSLQIYNGKVGFFNGGGNGWTTGATTVPANEWHHIAAVHDTAVGTTVYLDGVADGTSATKPVSLSQTKAVIGNLFAYTGGRTNFKGCLSEIRVWTRVLTAEEIQSRMHLRASGKETGLCACWPLEDYALDSTPEIVSGVRAALNPHFSSTAATEGLVLTEQPGPSIVAGTTLKGYSDNTNGIPTPLATLGDTFTVEAWVNPYQTSGQRWLVSQYPGAGRVNVQLDGAKLRLFQGDCEPNGAIAEQGAPGGVWSHVAATRTPTNICLYLNGVCVTNVPVTRYVAPVQQGVWLGVPAGTTSKAFSGFLQELRIWSIARTGEEIRADMGATLTGTEPGLAAFYPMSECAGPAIRDLVSGADAVFPSETFGWNATPRERVALERRAGGAHHAVLFPPAVRKCFYNVDGGSDSQVVSNVLAYANTGVTLTNADFTLEAWVNPLPQETASGEERHIIGQFKLDVPGRMALFLKNGHLQGCLRGTDSLDLTNVVGRTVIPCDRWTHVAYVHEGTCRRLYVNGVLDAENDDGATLPPTDQTTLMIGALAGSSSGFKGRIAEVRAWSRARTAKELAQFMGHRLTGGAADLAGYWPLDGNPEGALVNARRGGANGQLFNTTLEPTDFELDEPLQLGTLVLIR